MKRKLVLIAVECIVVFVLVPLLALYKARHDSGQPCMFTADSIQCPFAQRDSKTDLSEYSDEELEQIIKDSDDPDAELRRKFAYVAERGDRENERRQAQNAVNWLSSNTSASLGDENAAELRGYAEQFYTGTKERTNDWTYEERQRRYSARYKQAQCLTVMAQFVVDENGDKEQYAEDTRQSKNLLNFLTNHTSKFDAMSDYDVAKMTEHMKGMYDAAAGRRGLWRKTLDRLFSWTDGFFKVEWESQMRWHRRRTNK